MEKSKIARIRRHARIRKRLSGSSERPRVSIFKSARHIYAQIIDDANGVTLVSASSMDKELRGSVKHGGNREAAKKVGEALAKRAIDKGLRRVVFDRGGFLYHGRIKELADSAREAGLEF